MMDAPALLLALTGLGIVLRYRQVILLFMGVEILVASAAWLALLAIDQHAGHPRAAIFVVFAIAVGAAEAAIGLAIVVRLAHRHGTTEVSAFTTLKD